MSLAERLEQLEQVRGTEDGADGLEFHYFADIFRANGYDLLQPGDPLPPPMISVAEKQRPGRAPCRINGYGGTVFSPPEKSYKWTQIVAHMRKWGYTSAKTRNSEVADLLKESGFEAIMVPWG